MHDVARSLVERGDLLLEIRRAEIDVLRSRDVAGRELLRRAHIEDTDLLFADELLRLGRVDVFDCGLFLGLRAGEPQQQRNECDDGE